MTYEPAPPHRLQDASELLAVEQVLARAFCDNPLNVAVISTQSAERRLRANRHALRGPLRAASAQGGVWVARSGPRIVAGLITTPPGLYPLPQPPLVSKLLGILGQGLRTASRWGEVHAALQALHPIEPHWYLSSLGVDPDAQGAGFGSALLGGWLERVDREAAPAYLETDRQATLRFYSRAGFQIKDSATLLGVPIWTLWRPPRE
ncbi:GNAT family N-acetyltransferase [Myxococcota bacterium]|nr:GNAT family N-acetyltransferase [Myxococcota bacterium]